jgi:PD-(D/E)XK endonuclease
MQDRPPSPGRDQIQRLQLVRPPPEPELLRRDYIDQIDFFGVYCPETREVYLVPIEDAPLRRQGALRVLPARNNQSRNIRNAASYQIADFGAKA